MRGRAFWMLGMGWLGACAAAPDDTVADDTESDETDVGNTDETDEEDTDDEEDDTDKEATTAFWRSFLSGDGDATPGGATTTQGWLIVSSRSSEANAEAACVEDEYPSVDVCPIATYRSDGRLVSSNSRGTLGFPAYFNTWEVDGDEITVVEEFSANTFISVARLEELGLTEGKRRVRFHHLSATDPSGTYSVVGQSATFEEATDTNLPAAE